MTYYVVTPFEVFPEDKFIPAMEQLARENRHVMAIVFNCKDYDDFREKYFGS